MTCTRLIFMLAFNLFLERDGIEPDFNLGFLKGSNFLSVYSAIRIINSN